MDTAVTTPRASTVPFEGSERARDFIARLEAFVRDELHPLAREHGITHESGAERALLERVWRRSRELGFYGMTLPEALGGAGFDLVDHVLIKEAIYASGSPLAPHVLGELTGPSSCRWRAPRRRSASRSPSPRPAPTPARCRRARCARATHGY
jgi:alkylation response protein AidB-like acyl-CoA dehydrogenase